jgi:hypothetical protein
MDLSWVFVVFSSLALGLVFVVHHHQNQINLKQGPIDRLFYHKTFTRGNE